MMMMSTKGAGPHETGGTHAAFKLVDGGETYECEPLTPQNGLRRRLRIVGGAHLRTPGVIEVFCSDGLQPLVVSPEPGTPGFEVLMRLAPALRRRYFR